MILARIKNWLYGSPLPHEIVIKSTGSVHAPIWKRYPPDINNFMEWWCSSTFDGLNECLEQFGGRVVESGDYDTDLVFVFKTQWQYDAFKERFGNLHSRYFPAILTTQQPN